jgi:hypothetical protein
MRLPTLLVVALIALGASARATEIRTLNGPTLMATTVALQTAQQTPQTPPKAEVDINVNRHGGGRWYASPVWIAIGVLALIVIVLLIVLAARSGGGGTTIVRG